MTAPEASVERGAVRGARTATAEGVGAWPAGKTFFNGNLKSVPTYGHTFLGHGHGAKATRSLLGEAAGSGVQH